MKKVTLLFKTVLEYKEFLRSVKVMPAMYNRVIKDAHAKSMGISIERIGVQRGINIIYTNAFTGEYEYYFADGQHLAKAILNTPDNKVKGHFVAMINEINAIYKIIPFVSLMNSTAKNWALEDYLNSWVTHGTKDYEYIRDIRLKTGYGLSGLIEAFSNRSSTGNTDFKNGVFKADKKNGTQLIELYQKAVAMGLRDSNSSFLALVRFFIKNPNINEVKFLKGISKEKHFGSNFNRDAFIALFNNISL